MAKYALIKDAEAKYRELVSLKEILDQNILQAQRWQAKYQQKIRSMETFNQFLEYMGGNDVQSDILKDI